jgi:hypothetical protein
MIKSSDLDNTMVQPDELTHREDEPTEAEIEALEHGEHKRRRTPQDGAFDLDEGPFDTRVTDDEDEDT